MHLLVPLHSSSSSSSDEDEKVHQSIRTKAIRNQLSINNVRAIIKHVVSNKSVLDAVHARAEEIERQVGEEKDLVIEQILQESPSGRKMTRNRAKKTNQPPLKIKDLHSSHPDKSISRLIQSDLPDGEEDDDVDDEDADADYKPNYNEEVGSILSTISNQPFEYLSLHSE